ncbi:MAG: purine-binding chemotaxis protein CheW [Magnetococcales bacterium]|nr:purine-binding chemotaxis protein CheW [Magnetococcales bacterium]
MLVSTFILGDFHLGIDIILIREINRSMVVTPIPGAPPFIRGMLNIRGKIITLYDLKQRLGWEDTESKIKGQDGQPIRPFNVILKTHDEVLRLNKASADKCQWEDPVGMMVDKLGDVHELSREEIMPAPANLKGISADFVEGVVEFKDNLLVLLNMASIFGTDSHEDET